MAGCWPALAEQPQGSGMVFAFPPAIANSGRGYYRDSSEIGSRERWQ